MKFRKTGRALVAAAALSMALGMTACSSDGGGGTTPKTSTSAVSQVPPPSAKELNSALKEALSEDGDATTKNDWMEGAEDDPKLIPNLVKSAKESGAKINITQVDATGVLDGNPTATASGTWTINGQKSDLVVPLVYVKNHWRVSKDWTCSMLQVGNMTSKICPPA